MLRRALLALAVSFACAAAGDLAGSIRAAQASGNYALAADLYARLVASGSDSPEIRSNWGIMLHLAGRNREAIDQLKNALSKQPGLAGANLFAGLSEIDLGAPRLALPYLEKAARLDPQSPAPHLALGKAYVALRDFARAHEHYAEAASIAPAAAEAWYGAGITSRSLADQKLEKAALSGPSPGQDELRSEAKQLIEESRSALARAIALDPASPRPHLILAESLAESGNLVEAIAEYQAALKLDPHLAAARLGLGTAYWRQRQFDDALPLLREYLASAPRDPEANAMLADILEQNGDPAAAFPLARLALAGNPSLIQAHVVLGRIYLARKQPKLAIAELEPVVHADTDGSSHYLLFRAYRDAGDAKSAQAALAAFERLRYHTKQP